MKIYKAKNSNKKAAVVLFVMQVVFGTLPAVLLLFFVFSSNPNPENGNAPYILAYISAAAIILCGFAYTILGRRYNILISGLKGEKALQKIAKKHRDYRIFINLPVRYKHNRSEIDMVMVNENGIIIVEVKNHSGTISGSDKDETWSQFKHFKDGRSTESEMKNPLKQISRQREILKNILRSKGHNVWIDDVVFFSNSLVRLNLSLSETSYVAAGEKELNDFISSYKGVKKLSREEVEDITKILKNLL